MAIAKAICKCEVCGKTFEFRKERANRSEARSFEAWAAENITKCPECKSKEWKEKIRKANEGLPNLTGSEKQIAWASDIRAKAIWNLQELLNDKAFKDVSEDLSAFADSILAQKTEARWWIDQRYKFGSWLGWWEGYEEHKRKGV